MMGLPGWELARVIWTFLMKPSLLAGHGSRSAKFVQSLLHLSVQGWFRKQLLNAVQTDLEVCTFVAATVCWLTCNTNRKLLAKLLPQVDMM